MYRNSEVEMLINDYIHSKRDREIVKRRLIDGMHYDELAEEFDLSERQIKNICYKNQNMIFELLIENK